MVRERLLERVPARPGGMGKRTGNNSPWCASACPHCARSAAVCCRCRWCGKGTVSPELKIHAASARPSGGRQPWCPALEDAQAAVQGGSAAPLSWSNWCAPAWRPQDCRWTMPNWCIPSPCNPAPGWRVWPCWRRRFMWGRPACWITGPAEPQAIIAIDGPAGTGKSTVTRLLAARLDLLHLTPAPCTAPSLGSCWKTASPSAPMQPCNGFWRPWSCGSPGETTGSR